MQYTFRIVCFLNNFVFVVLQIIFIILQNVYFYITLKFVKF